MAIALKLLIVAYHQVFEVGKVYGQRRPHDRFYFEQPKALIAGSNQIPKLDSGNFQIQQRHIHAELLAAFLRENWNISAEEVKIAEFLNLPLENPASSTNFTPPAEANAYLDQQNHLKVWRKRLQQLIDQGLVKLYQACAQHFPENLHKDVPTLCFNSNQSNRIAMSFQQFPDNKPPVWFQTRSPEGVKTVFSQLEKLRQQARLVQASELEDPNTTVIFLNPSETEWSGELEISELRKKLRLERVFSGSSITKVEYSDRYLRKQEAEVLVELLQGGKFDSQVQIIISTVEEKGAHNASAIKNQLTEAFTQLQRPKNNLKVEVKPFYKKHDISHGRVLEIYRQDRVHYKVIFDIGMTFLAREDEKYRVRFTTYVVIEKTT